MSGQVFEKQKLYKYTQICAASSFSFSSSDSANDDSGNDDDDSSFYLNFFL